MYKVRIKVIRKANYEDLSIKFELKELSPCLLKENDEFIYEYDKKVDGLCESAYLTLHPFLVDLALGKGHFYGKWMKNPYSALISCNDGFRPVSFLLERIEK